MFGATGGGQASNSQSSGSWSNSSTAAGGPQEATGNPTWGTASSATTTLQGSSFQPSNGGAVGGRKGQMPPPAATMMQGGSPYMGQGSSSLFYRCACANFGKSSTAAAVGMTCGSGAGAHTILYMVYTQIRGSFVPFSNQKCTTFYYLMYCCN